MNYIEFAERMKDKVQLIVGPDYKVSNQKVDKINTKGLQSIVIWNGKQKITPNIYLEKFYDEYLEGRKIEDIANEIITIYRNADIDTVDTFDSVNDFEAIKNKIYFKLINQKNNESNLKNIPYIPTLDLALIFCILIKHDEDGITNITITNDILANWNVSATEIYEVAKKNTPELFPPSVKSMTEVMRTMLVEEIAQNNFDQETMEIMDSFLEDINKEESKEETMFVATNIVGINGATWLFYENELKAFRNKIGSNLYILPSSIHEVILIPSNKRLSKENLLEMVSNVNNTRVPENEILSYNIYQYENDTEGITALF